jgi:hypothetical protein
MPYLYREHFKIVGALCVAHLFRNYKWATAITTGIDISSLEGVIVFQETLIRGQTRSGLNQCNETTLVLGRPFSKFLSLKKQVTDIQM